jgi:hypothetical protein
MARPRLFDEPMIDASTREEINKAWPILVAVVQQYDPKMKLRKAVFFNLFTGAADKVARRIADIRLLINAHNTLRSIDPKDGPGSPVAGEADKHQREAVTRLVKAMS